MGSCILREASGYLPAAVAAAMSNVTYNGTDVINVTLGVINTTTPTPGAAASAYSLARNCTLGKGGVCTKGLLYDFQVSSHTLSLEYSILLCTVETWQQAATSSKTAEH